MHLRILPDGEKAKPFYENHGSYHEGDAGLDLFCVEDQEVAANSTAWVNLGIKVAAYRDHESGKRPAPSLAFLVLPRSSISKTPLRVANSIGLIDAGYRGCLIAALDNRSDKPYTIKSGDRLMQAVAFDGSPITFELVESLDQTSRGTGGYGSTNKIAKVAEVVVANPSNPSNPVETDVSANFQKQKLSEKNDDVVVPVKSAEGDAPSKVADAVPKSEVSAEEKENVSAA